MNKTNNSTKCIGIVGLGLIGGSLGLDLQALGYKVHGLVNKVTTAEKAQKRGLAQVISTNTKILADCDLVILALPLNQLIEPSQEIINALPKSAVVTDVGSVKAPILKVWNQLHQHFVASHPMAGNNNSGVEAGQMQLFKNCPWVVTPEKNTSPYDIEEVHKLAQALGCQWITTEAQKHDEAVALISHLPVLISASLLRSMKSEIDPSIVALAESLASSGFADTTRVGGGNPTLGTAMLAHNTSAILKSLKTYSLSLKKFEEEMLSQDWMKILKELEKTKNLRSHFLNDTSKHT